MTPLRQLNSEERSAQTLHSMPWARPHLRTHYPRESAHAVLALTPRRGNQPARRKPTSWWRVRMRPLLGLGLLVCAARLLWFVAFRMGSVAPAQPVSPRSPSFAFATFFGSDSFLPAVQVLLHTLAATAPAFPLVLCVLDGVSDASLAAALRHAAGLRVHVQRWAAVPAPAGSQHAARWSLNWTKLRLWQLTQFTRVFYMDADVLVLRSLDDVFETRLEGFLGTPDWGKWTRPGSSKMNGGVFLFDPSEATFAELLEFATHTSKYRSREAEQGLLNAFFGPSGCCLSHAWNTQKTLSIHYPELFDLTAIRLLHFVGEKPWSSWASPATRALLPAEEQRRRALSDEWDTADFSDLHALWRATYLRLRGLEALLTLFEAGASGEGESGIEAAAPMPEDGDFVSRALWPARVRPRPQGRDPPLLAAARLAATGRLHTPYVGFASSAHDPPNWSRLEIGQTDAPAPIFAWSATPLTDVESGLPGVALALHPPLAELLRTEAQLADIAEMPLSRRYIRSHAVVADVQLLSDFADFFDSATANVSATGMLVTAGTYGAVVELLFNAFLAKKSVPITFDDE